MQQPNDFDQIANTSSFSELDTFNFFVESFISYYKIKGLEDEIRGRIYRCLPDKSLKPTVADLDQAEEIFDRIISKITNSIMETLRNYYDGFIDFKKPEVRSNLREVIYKTIFQIEGEQVESRIFIRSLFDENEEKANLRGLIFRLVEALISFQKNCLLNSDQCKRYITKRCQALNLTEVKYQNHEEYLVLNWGLRKKCTRSAYKSLEELYNYLKKAGEFPKYRFGRSYDVD